MKNHHLGLLRVTEAGAIAAAQWVGRGQKEEADKAATDAMRSRLNGIDFCAEIAIGEGKKDESFGLFDGEFVGFYSRAWRPPRGVETADVKLPNPANPPSYDIAVDPIEGTTPTAKGGYEAMSVIALANHGSMFKTDHFYMEKIAVGPEVSQKMVNISLRNSIRENIALVAGCLGKPMQHVAVCVLDRPRNDYLVDELREIGCRIKFISDCDVTACIAACEEDSGIDMYWSIGGSPEAVIAAAAMKCMGGFLQTQLWEDGAPLGDQLLELEDLVKGPTMFCATGITDGKLLKGVQFKSKGPVTHSIAMRSESKTIRRIQTNHGN